VDIIFTRCQGPGHKRLAIKEFLQALAVLAEEAGRDFSCVRDRLADFAAEQQGGGDGGAWTRAGGRGGDPGSPPGAGGESPDGWGPGAGSGAPVQVQVAVPGSLADLLGDACARDSGGTAAGSAGGSGGLEVLYRSLLSPSDSGGGRRCGPALLEDAGPEADTAAIRRAGAAAAAAVASLLFPAQQRDGSGSGSGAGAASTVGSLPQCNPLCASERGSRAQCLEEGLVDCSYIGSDGAPGLLPDLSSPPAAPTSPLAGDAQQVAALAARVSVLEAAGAARRRQLEEVGEAQARLAEELQQICARLGGGGGGSDRSASGNGGRTAWAEAVAGLAAQLQALEGAVAELRARDGGGGEGAGRLSQVEQKLSERQGLVEVALMKVRPRRGGVGCFAWMLACAFARAAPCTYCRRSA
jgi:hypothetical protein